jgi:myosin V
MLSVFRSHSIDNTTAEERTFHIFYQLLASSQKTKFWNKLAAATNETFKYVGSTKTDTIEGVSDADRFTETLQALALVGIVGKKLDTLMQSICIVLQLGNLSFKSKGGDSDQSECANMDELRDLAALMQVPERNLIAAFTERTFEAKNEVHKVPLNAEAAKDACDALAKEAYQKAFLWLVKNINQATMASVDEDKSSYGTIGLLDIFGFEAFPVNRFDQLCINYANEKLQQKFTEDVFRSVEAEYKAEGVPLAEITYDDNTDVLDLIEARGGLLAMLNEECIRPKGNDFDFVQKALQQNKSSPCLIVHRTDRMSFGIHHYAGAVMYDAEFFVSRNQDTLPTDLQAMAETSSNEIVKSPRSESVASTAKIVTTNKRALVSGGNGGKTNGGSNAVRQDSNLVAPTVWTKYKNQLSSLMKDLRKTRTRYIRCIKPNVVKAPLLMEHKTVVDQLQCAGVVAGITITRSTFRK